MIDVFWEVLIERTNDTKIDFTSSQLLEAIELTNSGLRYTLVLFPKPQKKGASEDNSDTSNQE